MEAAPRSHARHELKGDMRIAVLIVVMMACAITYQLLLPPVVGLANNGDFERLMGRVGLKYVVEDYHDNYFRYVNLTFAMGEPWWDSRVVSCQEIMLRVAMLASRLLSIDGLFDLRFLGVVNALCFLSAVWLLFLASRRVLRLGSLVLLALTGFVFADVGYASYFNSIYSEPASLTFLFLTLAASLHAIATPRPGIWPMALYAGAATLFIGAKAQNSTLGWLLAIWGICLFWRWRTPRWRAAAAAVAVLLAAFSGLHFQSTPAWIREANLYNTVFFGILRGSPSAQEDLAALGCDPALARYANTTYYSRTSPARDPEFRAVFYSCIHWGRIVGFYAAHPRQLLRVADRLAGYAFRTRPEGLGNFTKASGRSPRSRSQDFAVWSGSKARLPGSVWLVWLLLAGGFVAGLVAAVRSKDAGRQLLALLFALLWAMASVQYVTKLIGNGLLDNVKQLFLFNAMIDVGVIASVVWVVSLGRDALVQRWGRHAS